MPKVYIIIINWNGLTDTLECLESVFGLDYPVFQVIVVDNGSSDSSVEKIRMRYPHVILIESDKNLGFTGGNNLGMRHALEHNADYVWLLNNDTVVESNALTRLVDDAETSDDIAAASPVINCYLDKKRKQFAGSYVNWANLQILYPDRMYKAGDDYRYHGPDVCLWGTALLIKRKTLEKIGLLDDRYFAYWEDTEYSLRVIKNGLRNVISYDSIIYHKSPIDSSSLPKGKHYYYLMLRNRLFIRKEYLFSFLGCFFFYRDYISNLISTAGSCLQNNEMEKFNACMNGSWHGMKNIYGPMTDDNPMPKRLASAFKILSGWHPCFIGNLINCNFSKIFNGLYKKYKGVAGESNAS